MHKAVVYVNKGEHCPICARVLPYLHHVSRIGRAAVRDANRLDRIDKINRMAAARLRSDLDWQDQAVPVVYLDGEYIELKDLLARVSTYEIAMRQDADNCSKDFLF